MDLTPARLSVALRVTVTFALFQPAALGAGVTTALAVGGVLSILIPETLLEAVLPATSVHWPVAVSAAPSAEIV